MFKNAFVSVSNKTGLAEFLKPFSNQGMRVVSTGGTAKFLKEHKIPVVDIIEQTSFKEVFSGRVKSLHPHIYMPILARHWDQDDQKTLQEYGLQSFDLVICNLYPFEKHQSVKEDQKLVEWIDVGGPSLLRAAAKNFFTVTTLCSPEDYKQVQKGSNLEQRKRLAAKAFEHLSQYDFTIAQRLKNSKDSDNESPQKILASHKGFTDDSKDSDSQPQDFSLNAKFFKTLRYGENPHQKGSWYKKINQTGLHQAQILQGKELSFNNLLDFSNAITCLREFNENCCVAVKHNNPCGVACGQNSFLSVSQALEADPVSVFGGVLAVNSPIDKKTATKLTKYFLEGLIAVDFSKEALEILRFKKNLRVLKWENMMSFPLDNLMAKQILGGVLLQDRDKLLRQWDADWKVIGDIPSESIQEDLMFAYKVCAHLSSNAIAAVKDKQTLGLGMGQVNRVDAVTGSVERAKKFHSQKTQDMVLASDAFFPFADSIDIASQAGVRWIIQPGGSIKDDEVIKRAQTLGLNMVLTGQRHFKH